MKTYLMRQTLKQRATRSMATVSLVACVVGFVSDVTAGHLYRYKNTEGFWVISSSIPSDRVAQGYRVIDETGRVIEEVAAQRSPEEARIYLAQVEEERKRKEAIRRITLLYGSEADIDYALKKALRSIETSIANTRANLITLSTQRQSLEERAARIERAGNEISPSLVQNIQTLDEQIKTLEVEVASREKEKDSERARHADDRILFREVHEISVNL